jgi:hypothetical protein
LLNPLPGGISKVAIRGFIPPNGLYYTVTQFMAPLLP